MLWAIYIVCISLPLLCHSERGAPRSESQKLMVAGGNHTIIHCSRRQRSRRIFCVSVIQIWIDPLNSFRMTPVGQIIKNEKLTIANYCGGFAHYMK